MKKALYIVIGVFFLFQLGSSASAAESAKILSVHGKVQVKDPASGAAKDAEKGALLGQGTEIIAGPASGCQIALGPEGKSAVEVHEDSRAVLKSLNPVELDIKAGRLFSLVRDMKGSSFTVYSPTAVASARGTGWEQGTSEINVFEDTVHVQGTGGESVDVPEGKGADFLQDGSIGDLRDVPDAGKSEFNEFKDEAQSAIASESAAGNKTAAGAGSGAASNGESSKTDESAGSPESDFELGGSGGASSEAEKQTESGGTASENAETLTESKQDIQQKQSEINAASDSLDNASATQGSTH